MNPPSHRCRSVMVSAALAGALAVAGCSGGSAPAGSGGGSSRVTPSGVSFTSAPGSAALLAAAKQAVGRSASAHVAGTVVAGLVTVQVDLVVGDVSATGTLTAGSGRAQARVLGADLYVNGDAAFWDGLERGIGKQFADRWMRASGATAPEFGSLIGLVPLSTALDRWVPGGAPLVEAAGQQVHGIGAVALRTRTADRPDTLYLAVKSPYYPIMVEAAGGGSLTLSGWSASELTVTAPTGAVVDATRFSLHG